MGGSRLPMEREWGCALLGIAEFFEILVGAAGDGFEAFLEGLHVALGLLIESRELHHLQEGRVHGAPPEAHGAVDVEQQNDPLFIRIVPDFVLISVVEYENLAGTPDLDLVADADAAFLGIARNDEA